MTDTGDGAVLVTGATGGVGTAISIGLVERGLRVVLNARDREKLEDLEARLAGISRSGVTTVTGELATADDAQRVFDAATRHGHLSAVVNATGVFGPICEPQHLDAHALETVMRINVIAPIALCALALGPMLDQGAGRIVNITSAHPLHGPDAATLAYGTSKAALNFATRALAERTRDTAVSACVVHPGDIKTAMWADIRSQAAALGEAGRALAGWADDVERTGGDAPTQAARTVLDVIDREATWSNGRFIYAIGTQRGHPDPDW